MISLLFELMSISTLSLILLTYLNKDTPPDYGFDEDDYLH